MKQQHMEHRVHTHCFMLAGILIRYKKFPKSWVIQ